MVARIESLVSIKWSQSFSFDAGTRESKKNVNNQAF